MRVLIVCPYYYPATCYGGPVWSVHDTAKGLLNRGVETVVLTTSANAPKDGASRVETVDGVRVHYHCRFRRSGWYLSTALARTVAEMAPGFDLLFVQGVWTWPTAAGCAIARHLGKSCIITPHGSFDPWALGYRGAKKRLYLSLVERRNLSRADAVHCLTSREADQVRTIAPQARCEVIPNAAMIFPGDLTAAGRTAFAGRFPSLSGKRVALFLSRIHQKKGLDLLVPAFARVVARFPDAHLVIAGPDEGGYRATVERLIERYAIGATVTFTGLLNGQDKLAAFDRAEVFVLPSYSEGLPVAVLEALAFGKPVVVTDPCNITDEIRGADAGLVVDTTVQAVAEGLMTMLADPDRARAMGEAGSRLVKERFSLEAVSGRLVGLFEELVQRHRAS